MRRLRTAMIARRTLYVKRPFYTCLAGTLTPRDLAALRLFMAWLTRTWCLRRSGCLTHTLKIRTARTRRGWRLLKTLEFVICGAPLIVRLMVNLPAADLL